MKIFPAVKNCTLWLFMLLSSGWSWNSTGGANTITRTATGAYTATLGGMAGSPNGGMVLVTASGFSNAYCTTDSMTP